jgi:hypothetical protein
MSPMGLSIVISHKPFMSELRSLPACHLLEMHLAHSSHHIDYVELPLVDLKEFSKFHIIKCKVAIAYGNPGASSESMRRHAESVMKASELCGRPSWSRANRRQRTIQAKLRSTTHRLGSG